MYALIRSIVISGLGVAALAGCADLDTDAPQNASDDIVEASDDAETDVASQEQALHKDASRKDFNLDGRTDILWHNPGSGVVNTWLLNGTTVVANPNVNWNVSGSSGWRAAGTGDFNADGKTDILWHHAGTGTVNVWLLNGRTVIGNPNINWNVLGSSGWVLRGTGDFNNDGRTDLLWHHAASGQVNTWLLNGTTVIGNPNINWNVLGSSGWQLKGTGDFNKDGRTDLLWHHPGNGTVNTWLLNGTTVIGNPSLNWKVFGSSGWQIVSR
ncbi:MAG: VCBS repeat-containing protein [Polyangiales bacterium]